MGKNNIKASTTPVSLTEHLSALLDDEVGSFEQRRVLDELKSDDKLKQQLSSYALIGEVMRSSEATVTASSTFLSGIHEQIKSDDDYNQIRLNNSANDDEVSVNIEKKQVTQTTSWLRPVGGLALAASVAAVAVIGFQSYQSNDSNGINSGLMSTSLDNLSKEKMAVATSVTAGNKTTTEAISSSQYQQADFYQRQLLKSYVDSHMEYASNTSFVPAVRFITYTN